jgi:hypothetical protein
MTRMEEEAKERIGSLAVDSGAFSLYSKEVGQKRKNGKRDFSYYETDEYWEYVDEYCSFLLDNQDVIDFYVNVDVIFNPELSWKTLKYMERKGLSPLPVIHHGADLKWIRRYLKEGYEFIGLGGLGQEMTVASYYAWADKVFDYICPRPSRLPKVRVHGFAMTAYDLMLRYPWWSVDSASWAKAGAWGFIFIPHKRNGRWDFSETPYKMATSIKSPDRKRRGHHINTLSPMERKIVMEWLEYIGIPFGGDNEQGVLNHHESRKVANVHFFHGLQEWFSLWPRPLEVEGRKGLLYR